MYPGNRLSGKRDPRMKSPEGPSEWRIFEGVKGKSLRGGPGGGAGKWGSDWKSSQMPVKISGFLPVGTEGGL